MNLRDELGARKSVDFSIELPRGWSRFDIDGGRDILLARMKKRFMEGHRPDLFADAKVTFEKAFEGMRANGVFAFFAPAVDDPGSTIIPASINASIRTGVPAQSLDKLVHDAIKRFGAKPLFGDPRTIRFERERVVDLGGESVVNHSLVYLTPVPGTQRREALQLVAGFARTPDIEVDSPPIVATRVLLDSCVATLSWPRSTV